MGFKLTMFCLKRYTLRFGHLFIFQSLLCPIFLGKIILRTREQYSLMQTVKVGCYQTFDSENLNGIHSDTLKYENTKERSQIKEFIFSSVRITERKNLTVFVLRTLKNFYKSQE